MTCERMPPEKLVSRYSHRPRDLINSMISISDGAKPSAIHRDASSSSIGLLGALPVELIHLALDKLDFQSLSRVSCVSLRGKEVVESLPAYQMLMEHAPHTLTALGRTGLITLHPATRLHATLLSEQCLSCGEYGAFLFLPTCQRCCDECLHRSPAFWVFSIAVAEKCFDIPRRQFKDAPIMHSVPGRYDSRRITRQRRLKLISVRAAKELAIKIHGSLEEMAVNLAAKHRGRINEDVPSLLRWFQKVPEGPLRQDLSVESTSFVPNDEFFGMASIPFPSIGPNSTIQHGLWCRGCDWIFKLWLTGQLTPTELSHLMPQGCYPFLFFSAMRRCAMSIDGFLEHVKDCRGAREEAEI